MKRGSSERYALTEEQVRTLLRHTTELPDRIAIMLMVYLGMRAEEVTHLHAGWVRQGLIAIPAAQKCDCVNCRENLRHPGEWRAKTKASMRSIPVPEGMAAEFYRWLNESPQGLRISRQALWQKVKRIGKAAGIKESGLSRDTTYPHALRATAATRFASKGMDIYSLMYIMGWSDMRIAQRYIQIAQAIPEAQKKLKEILG